MFRWWTVFRQQARRGMTEPMDRLPLRLLLLGDGSLASPGGVAQWLQLKWCAARPQVKLFRPARQMKLRVELLEDRTLRSASPWEAVLPADTRDTAANIGVAPGVHLNNLRIDYADDQDWYRFELLRDDSLDFKLTFSRLGGDLSLQVTDSQGTMLGTGELTSSGLKLTLNGLSAGTYYIHASGAINSYSLDIDPSASSSTTVYYVNDGDTANDFYSRAAGDDNASGRTPDAPMASVQKVLDTYVLGPHDLIVIDTGIYNDPVSITADDEGAAYAGSPAGSSFNGSGTRIDVSGADGNLFYGLSLTATDGAGFLVHADGDNDADNNILSDNTIASGGDGTYGIALTSSGAAIVRNNTISGWTCGIYSATANATITGNSVHDNDTGLEGSGTFGGTSWDTGQANDVFNNDVGVRASGATVAFNRIHGNSTGIQAESGSTVDHNIIYRNATGILVDNGDTVTITSNTIYTASGDGVRIQNHSANVSLRNNIIWTESGYDLYVSNDSQAGFASDYNNLFTSGSGIIVYWQKDFIDLFDWQVEGGYDRHSIGYTTLATGLDDPQFVDLAGDDYHLSDAVSTSIDAADPASAYDLEPGVNGGCIDLGAYGGTAEAAQSRSAYIKIDAPTFYTDWEAAVGHAVVWHTYDAQTDDHALAGKVKIDLYREGFGFVSTIATVPATKGTVTWTPSSSAVAGNAVRRYRIQITSVANADISDTTREAFAVVPAGHNYYVNDDSKKDNQYTSAAGSNRNTGKTAADPKANVISILAAYDLGRGDTIVVDTGKYLEVRNVLVSGTLGNDAGVAITGPTVSGKVAILDRGNTADGAAVIEVNDGDSVMLRNLSLTGAQTGLWVHNGSTAFNGSRLTAYRNAQEGFKIESDTAYSMTDSTANDNDYGFLLSGAGAGRLERNIAFANNTSFSVYSTGPTPTIIGNPDLKQGKGNKVYNNTVTGIHAAGNVQIVGNTVYGQSGPDGTGIVLLSSSAKALVRNNVVFDNYDGIAMPLAGVADGNRVYHNSHYGFNVGGSVVLRNNVVYSNEIGVVASGGTADFTGILSNNLVYANLIAGVVISGGGDGASLINNTIYQPFGDALRVQNGSQNVTLRNNILWVQSGYAINVDPDSERGFNSDYNATYVAGSGNIAAWAGVAQPTLLSWRISADSDGSSLSLDPWFNDPYGTDGVLGYLDPLHDGRDDDFHEQSLYGSLHGGSLAPVVNVANGLPLIPTGTWSVDQRQSPTIDRGSPLDSYARESGSNGGAVNLGAYGNTSHASKSAPPNITVTLHVPVANTFADAYLAVNLATLSDVKHLLGTAIRSALELDLMGGFAAHEEAADVDTVTYEVSFAEDVPDVADEPILEEDAIELGRLLASAAQGLGQDREFLLDKAAATTLLSSLEGSSVALLALGTAQPDVSAKNEGLAAANSNDFFLDNLTIENATHRLQDEHDLTWANMPPAVPASQDDYVPPPSQVGLTPTAALPGGDAESSRGWVRPLVFCFVIYAMHAVAPVHRGDPPVVGRRPPSNGW